MGTWIVGAVVFSLIGLAAHKVYKDRREGAGCGGCCSSCSQCPGHIKEEN